MKTLHETEPTWPLSTMGAALAVPRSTFYYQSYRSGRQDDAALRTAITETAGSWPRYGSARIAAQLRRDGFHLLGKPVGERRVRRVMRQMGLLAKPAKRRVRTTNSDHGHTRYRNLVKDLEIVRPNQVWVSDSTYIALGSGFVYLAVIMDIYTRSIRGWALSRGLEGDLTLKALNLDYSRTRPLCLTVRGGLSRS